MMNLPNDKKVVVIGAGFAGLSAAACLAKDGYAVTLLEKNTQTGGRARMFRQDGFLFDMGPSWYWMPEVMEQFYNRFGKTAADYYELVRLDPSYQVIFGGHETMHLSADFSQLKRQFEVIEPGSGKKLEQFLKGAKYKYDVGMREFVYKPSVSLWEYIDRRILKSVFYLDMLKPFSQHVRQFFKDPRLIQLLEFPVLFLGAMPAKTPALYSMMNYADIQLGTWYPMGGMHKIAEAMTDIAVRQGVDLKLNTTVEKIEVVNGKAVSVHTDKEVLAVDYVVAGADYHHVEQDLLEIKDRNYSSSYWESRTMAPSCLVYYLGVGKKIPRLLHHNLFFESDFTVHANSIYTDPSWPEDPLFYVCCPSKTDDAVAPAGMENLFVLIPVAAGLQDTPEIREKYFEEALSRIEKFTLEKIRDHLVFKHSYAYSDFVRDYNSFKGNAYGLANTLPQTGFLKPSIQSKKVDNLFYTGHLTVPGPGVPPSIISGQVVADFISKSFKTTK